MKNSSCIIENQNEETQDKLEHEAISRISLLKGYLNYECNNLFCYSTNYLMSEPKKGYETEWEIAEQKVKLLEEMISQLTVQEEVFV